jgi:hypothetical protein
MSTTEQRFIPISQQSDIFVDAYFIDDNNRLLFLSFVGRDTAAMQFLARLQLNEQQADGLGQLTFLELGSRADFVATRKKTVFLDKDIMNRLEKTMCKIKTHSFGLLNHVWLIDPVLSKPNLANRSGYLVHKKQGALSRAECGQDDQALWALMKSISPLPLLDSWMGELLQLTTDEAWLDNFATQGSIDYRCRGVWVAYLKLPDDFEAKITAAIQSYRLAPV